MFAGSSADGKAAEQTAEVDHWAGDSSLADFRVRNTEIIGTSQPINAVREFARRVARGDAKVLITGESGVGKDVVARFIHEHSPRASRPFVPVNCAGISETLLESELFGHVKGSFTGAYRDKTGRLQLANRGTVMLDELGEMSTRMQALLLRFLENGEIHPVGSDGITAKIDVRVIAATNRDLQELVEHGVFREDLLYRIKVVQIHVPPLRERPCDIRLLVEHLIARMGGTLRFSDAAFEVMEGYRWPGNVRELYNVVEQASWLGDGDEIRPEHLPLAISAANVVRMPRRGGRNIDDLYQSLAAGRERFWEHVYTEFIQRDLTREDIRALVRRGLAECNGNYRALLPLFGIVAADYKRFLNFLAAHNCQVDYRAFRPGVRTAPGPASAES